MPLCCESYFKLLVEDFSFLGKSINQGDLTSKKNNSIYDRSFLYLFYSEDALFWERDIYSTILWPRSLANKQENIKISLSPVSKDSNFSSEDPLSL